MSDTDSFPGPMESGLDLRVMIKQLQARIRKAKLFFKTGTDDSACKHCGVAENAWRDHGSAVYAEDPFICSKTCSEKYDTEIVKCDGCRINHGSQKQHTGPGGCLEPQAKRRKIDPREFIDGMAEDVSGSDFDESEASGSDDLADLRDLDDSEDSDYSPASTLSTTGGNMSDASSSSSSSSEKPIVGKKRKRSAFIAESDSD